MDITTIIIMAVTFFLLGFYPGNIRFRSAFHRKLRTMWKHVHELKINEENDGQTAHPVA